MPYINSSQGVNISSGIGQGEAQVFNPYIVKTDVGVKDFASLRQKQADDLVAKNKEIKDEQTNQYKNLEDIRLQMNKAKLLPKYAEKASDDLTSIYNNLIDKYKYSPELSPIDKAELMSKVQDLSTKISSARQLTEDYYNRSKEIMEAEQKPNIDIFGKENLSLLNSKKVDDWDKSLNDDLGLLGGVGFSKYNNYSDVVANVQKSMKSEQDTKYNTLSLAGQPFVETKDTKVFNEDELQRNSSMISSLATMADDGTIMPVNKGADAIGVAKFAQSNYPLYVQQMKAKEQTPKDLNQWLFDESRSRLSYSDVNSDLKQISIPKATNVNVNTGGNSNNKQGGLEFSLQDRNVKSEKGDSYSLGQLIELSSTSNNQLVGNFIPIRGEFTKGKSNVIQGNIQDISFAPVILKEVSSNGVIIPRGTVISDEYLSKIKRIFPKTYKDFVGASAFFGVTTGEKNASYGLMPASGNIKSLYERFKNGDTSLQPLFINKKTEKPYTETEFIDELKKQKQIYEDTL